MTRTRPWEVSDERRDPLVLFGSYLYSSAHLYVL